VSTTPVKSNRMADQVAAAMLERIREENLSPGDRLPTEREIGEQYGVSRTVVREATRFLLARGVVEVGSGRGLVVSRVEGDTAAESLTLFLQSRVLEDYASVHEIRELLEVEAARRAAVRADEESVALLRETHRRMSELRDSDDLDALSHADIEFHRALAHASGNDIFVVLLDAVAPALMSPRLTNLVDAEGRAAALAGHDAILAAVLDGDAEAAGAAMRRQLDTAVTGWTRAKRAG
jgi:GntR family transcriptional repressor for pyruvate dehydrogenase complex